MSQMLGRRSAAWGLFVVLFFSWDAYGQAVYDFSSSAGVDRFASGNSIRKDPIPPLINNIPSVEFSAADYTAVAVSDDLRYSTGTVVGPNRVAVRFAFSIADRTSTIPQFDRLRPRGGI